MPRPSRATRAAASAPRARPPSPAQIKRIRRGRSRGRWARECFIRFRVGLGRTSYCTEPRGQSSARHAAGGHAQPSASGCSRPQCSSRRPGLSVHTCQRFRAEKHRCSSAPRPRAQPDRTRDVTHRDVEGAGRRRARHRKLERCAAAKAEPLAQRLRICGRLGLGLGQRAQSGRAAPSRARPLRAGGGARRASERHGCRGLLPGSAPTAGAL